VEWPVVLEDYMNWGKFNPHVEREALGGLNRHKHLSEFFESDGNEIYRFIQKQVK
jgi:hypothetical protein